MLIMTDLRKGIWIVLILGTIRMPFLRSVMIIMTTKRPCDGEVGVSFSKQKERLLSVTEGVSLLEKAPSNFEQETTSVAGRRMTNL